MFSPEPGNEYLEVPVSDSDDYDEEKDGAGVVTSTGMADGMKRVRRHQEVGPTSKTPSIQQKKDMGLEPDF